MKKFYILVFFSVFCAPHFFANYMLIQNVTTVGDNPGAKTIKVQFDISWQNSWRDAINWDAAWLFIKYKDGAGNWGHAHISSNGFNNGSGTANTLNVTDDNVGAFLYRSGLGSGNFTCTGMQLQWDYGQNGLSSVSGLELQVFAIETVYIPGGEYNLCKKLNGGSTETLNGYSNTEDTEIYLYAPGDNHPVINSRLTPTLTYKNEQHSDIKDTIRIKGDLGIDTDNDGVVDNTSYPTGYQPFYVFKYELTEQQYADFYNTLSPAQQSNISVVGNYITLVNGKYVSSRPNSACKTGIYSADESVFFSYADWCGLRPMSYLEFQKSIWGNEKIDYNDGVFASNTNSGLPTNTMTYPILDEWAVGYYDNLANGEETMLTYSSSNEYKFYFTTRFYSNWYTNMTRSSEIYPIRPGIVATSTSTREDAISSFYGVMDYTGNLFEPFVNLHYYDFLATNGDGLLDASGNSNIANWTQQSDILSYADIRVFKQFTEYYTAKNADIRSGYTFGPMGIRLCRSAP